MAFKFKTIIIFLDIFLPSSKLKLFFNAYYSSFKLINILTKSANCRYINLQIADLLINYNSNN